MRLNGISLFSGAGGMDVGAIRAGFKIVGALEIDHQVCCTYKANHPDIKMLEGDINEYFDEIKQYKGVDLIIGGPPCQGFSVAGKMDFLDPRSKLVFSYCKALEIVKPKAFIMENVKSLGTLAKFQTIRQEIVNLMEKAGYKVTINILNAKDFGVPQSRERVFFIGVQKGYKAINLDDFDIFKEKAISLREAIIHLGKAGTSTNPHKTNAKITLAKKPILRKSPYAGMLFNGQGRPLNPDSWSSTLPATMGGNRTPIIDEDHLYDYQTSWVEHYHEQLMSGKVDPKFKKVPSRLRRLTIDEAAILQTFPPNYKFLGSQSKIFSQIGNAVPCKLAEVVTRVLQNSLQRK